MSIIVNMKDLIRKILREQTEFKKDAIKSLIKKSGLEFTAKVMGGISNIIDNVFDGDIINFSEYTTTPLAYMSTDGLNLYLHEGLVNKLGFEDVESRFGEKKLGNFRFGDKTSANYIFTARLNPTRIHDQTYYRVVGMSGEAGFGYSIINKNDTLGKRYRQQIFKQIINKYGLEPYMKVKTFY